METTIIGIDRSLDSVKLKNLFLTVIALNFIWMFFHFTVVFFFTLNLKSVALVGAFLGIGNFFAFLLDIPIGIIQNYFKPKTLYIIACISQLVAMGIFLTFILNFNEYVLSLAGGKESLTGFLLGNSINIFLLLIVSVCYGLTKELQDVTTISYILNNANPDQYNSILARNNIAMGIGSLVGLVVSGFILAFAPILIIVIMILCIFLIIYFTSNFFDNGKNSINLADVYKFSVSVKNGGLKEKVLKTVNKIELKNIIGSTKYLFIKPVPIKSGLTIGKLIEETKTTFILTYKVLSRADSPLIIYRSMIMLLTFGFRDTFASTFLIDFLDQVKQGWSYILLGIIAIPAFGLQDFFGKLAEKFGSFKVANFGLILSGISLVLMGFFSESGPIVVMSFALINSAGYAACMSLSQSVFLDSYNKSYADYNKLKEIDANASAAPMKILQNMANVVGLVLGGAILFILNYIGFFILFGASIIGLLIWGLKRKKDINE